MLAEFQVMLREYCHAGNEKEDTNSFGGYWRSDNLPQRLPKETKTRTKGLYLSLQSDDATFAEKYEGIVVRLVNGGHKKEEIFASDSRIDIVQEALDSDGVWKAIEYLPSSWCGNSYHTVYLEKKHYWSFVAPKYSGPQKTRIRFWLSLSSDLTIYSESYDGGVHPK